MATQFDYSNIGSIFGGGGTPSGLDALLTEDQRKLMGRNAALSAAAALLQAGGRSPQRIGLGQALGSALQAGQQGYQQARAGSLQDMLLAQKLEEAKRAEALRQQIADVMTTAPQPLNTAQAALAAPGMPLGPTTQRAELMDSMPQPTANELKANQYQTIADIYAAQGKSEDAKRFQEMAERFNPRPEVTGQPFEVTDATGNPVLVQQMKSGALQTLPGFGPKREVVLQSLGGRTVAINKSALKGGESYAMSMTPGEVASNLVARGNLDVARGNLGIAQRGLGLREAEFNRGAFDIRETADGLAYVSKAPGGATMPVVGTGGQQLMPAKEAPGAFSEAAKKLNNLKGNISSYKTELASDKMVFPSQVPLPFGASIPLPTGSDTARMRGKYQSLLMGVKDLYELGALTGPDMGIIEQQLTNPASFSGVFTSRAAMMEQVKVLEDMAKRAEENLTSTYKRKIPGASTAGIQPQAGQLRPTDIQSIIDNYNRSR
jgi:hypothetical protein